MLLCIRHPTVFLTHKHLLRILNHSINACTVSKGWWGEWEKTEHEKLDAKTQGVQRPSDLGNSAIRWDPNSLRSPFLRILRIG